MEIKFNSKIKEWAWLSNMHPCVIFHMELEFCSIEAAYMASKCPSEAERFVHLSGWQAKKLGRTVKLQPDWNIKKGYIMGSLLRKKFLPTSELGHMLISTGDAILIEHAPWDKYWGDGGDGTGKNVMGRLLMKIRKEISMS